MKKLEYIQPNIKIHVRAAYALLYTNTGEQGNDPGDSEGKVGFFDDEDESNAWGNVWK